MESCKLVIEDGIYGSDLMYHLFKLSSQDDTDKKIIEAIKTLCTADLIKGKNFGANILFSGNDINVHKYEELISSCQNKEIIARWCDYSQEKNKERRPELIKNACSAYLTVFESTRDYSYLIRRMQLIHKVKVVFSDELNSIFEYCKRIIYESDSPYWQMQLLTELASIDRENSKKEFSFFLEKNIEIFCDKEEYISARFLIDSLKIISSINTNEWHIRRAMNFESEGDSLVKIKEPNYYYPKISKIYLEGLREINKTQGCKDLKYRLEQKVEAEQIENYKMIQVCGVNIAPDINHEKIKKFIIGAGIKDFQTGYSNILLVPIIPICDIERYKDGIQDNSFSRQYFSDHVKINNKGCNIGKSQIDEYELVKIRNDFRERIISFLKPVKLVMDIDRKIERDFVFYLIDQCNSKFIPKEREYIFAEGLYAGFQNDFILSSHLLIPQIENSLKFIAQQNNTTISKLAEEIQQDNTLGGILEKIKNITKADLYAELYGFLVDANDTNFRNELCHGLMNPVLIEHYGIYLWWLSLKMIIQTEDYFSFT